MLSKTAFYFSQLFKDLTTPLKKEKSKTGFIAQIIVEIKDTGELELSFWKTIYTWNSYRKEN